MKEKICDNPLLGSLQIKDYVNKLNIIETAQIIQKSNLLLTADGGLLHIANSFNIRSISLLPKRIQPKFRLVKKIKSYALYNQDSVDNIDYNEIVNYINLFLETPYENWCIYVHKKWRNIRIPIC